MLSEDEIKEEMAKFLSNTDFTKYLSGVGDKIVKYSELDQYKDAFHLLPEHEDYRIILIEHKLNVGHWVCIVRRGNDFCFFDSYGHGPLQNLNFISKSMNRFLGQTREDFSGLFKDLKKGTYKLEHNKKKFQRMSKDINTCGRFVIVFISKWMIKGMNLQDFQKWIEQNKKETGYNYDEIVTLLTV